MSKYYYNRYTVKRRYYAKQDTRLLGENDYQLCRPIGGGSITVRFYSHYEINEDTGVITLTGDLIERVPGEYPVVDYYIRRSQQSIMKVSEWTTEIKGETYHKYYEVSSEFNEVRGDLLQENIVAEDGIYPNNGKHSDGYWYVKGDLAFPEIKMRINGQLKTSENGWVKANGQLREIETMWVRVNGAIKEVQ